MNQVEKKTRGNAPTLIGAEHKNGGPSLGFSGKQVEALKMDNKTFSQTKNI